MQIFIKSLDTELWEIVNNIPYAVPKTTNDKGEEVDKPKDQYITSDWDKLTTYSRANTHFYCGLDATNIIEFLLVI